MTRYPQLSLANDAGHEIVRDGVVVAFYVREPHRRISQLIPGVLSAYRNYIGPKSLEWYIDEEGELAPLSATEYDRIVGELERAASPNYNLRLSDSLYEADRFRFAYAGFDVGGPAFQRWPNAASYLELWFPTDFFVQSGAEAFRQFATGIAASLPFASGYASLAFNAVSGPGEREAWEFIHARCFEYPGLDIHAPDRTSLEIGTRIRGAWWLNFFGPSLLEACGGATRFGPLRHYPDIRIEEMDEGKLLVTAGSEPAAGDVLSPIPEGLRALAQLMRPFVLHPSFSLPGLRNGETERWISR